MTEQSESKQPCAESAMLIRRPVHEVFAAFVDPVTITKFWFTKSSGKLETGKKVQWDWEMYNVSAQVTVQSVAIDEHIHFVWDGYDTPTVVQWSFAPHGEEKTFVTITECGFTAQGEKLVTQVAEATGGWTLVLAGCKAYLEHNIQLGLIVDRFPAGH